MSPIGSLLWVFSSVLAVVFLVVGFVKAFRYQQARKRFSWAMDVPRWLVQAIGGFEILAALGLILPAATGIYPQLSMYAAAGLAILMLSAGTFHAQRREREAMTLNVLLLLLAAFVAYGRWTLIAGA